MKIGKWLLIGVFSMLFVLMMLGLEISIILISELEVFVIFVGVIIIWFKYILDMKLVRVLFFIVLDKIL